MNSVTRLLQVSQVTSTLLQRIYTLLLPQICLCAALIAFVITPKFPHTLHTILTMRCPPVTHAAESYRKLKLSIIIARPTSLLLGVSFVRMCDIGWLNCTSTQILRSI